MNTTKGAIGIEPFRAMLDAGTTAVAPIERFELVCNGKVVDSLPLTGDRRHGTFDKEMSVSESGSGASMAVDAQGNLYVTDFWNHRVLKYNSPFTTDTIADDVTPELALATIASVESMTSDPPLGSGTCRLYIISISRSIPYLWKSGSLPS